MFITAFPLCSHYHRQQQPRLLQNVFELPHTFIRLTHFGPRKKY